MHDICVLLLGWFARNSLHTFRHNTRSASVVGWELTYLHLRINLIPWHFSQLSPQLEALAAARDGGATPKASCCVEGWGQEEQATSREPGRKQATKGASRQGGTFLSNIYIFDRGKSYCVRGIAVHVYAMANSSESTN